MHACQFSLSCNSHAAWCRLLQAWARLAIQDVPIPANADRHGHEQSAYDSKHGKGTRPRTTWGQLVFLCWSHVVISWGFFIFQSWIPTYLHHKGMHDLGLMGSLSALPWGVGCPSCGRAAPPAQLAYAQRCSVGLSVWPFEMCTHHCTASLADVHVRSYC